MSARSTGSLHELEAVKHLKNLGYIPFKPQKTSRFGTQDIFNMFDVVAIKKSHVKFVQVKTNSTRGFLKKLKSFVAEHGFFYDVSFELWVRKNKKTDKRTWDVYMVKFLHEEVEVKKYQV